MTSTYQFLDQAEEDALHKNRLLMQEERPFKRLSKRLLGTDSIISTRSLPTPPPESTTEDEPPAKAASAKDPAQEYAQFKEDALLDFANFESSIVRMQFLFNSNEKERERYATEKIRIQETGQEVRDSTAELRKHLEEAQKTLAVRKTWDELAEKITSNRLLKPRDEQQANLQKLNDEIAELERESKEYAATWAERREQFGKIIDEGMQLRRLIRDEKEEVERREGMEEHEDGEDGDAISRGHASNAGTPRPGTPGGATPMHTGPEADSGSLAVDSFLHPRSKSPLRASSQGLDVGTPRSRAEEPEEIDMIEDGEVSGDGESEGLVDDRSERNGGDAADTMDTT